MDVVDVVSAISQFIVGVLAVMGAATYFIVRRMQRQTWETQADIDLMYRLHKMEPPRVGREKMYDALKKLK